MNKHGYVLIKLHLWITEIRSSYHFHVSQYLAQDVLLAYLWGKVF